jgi:hypothetical protein
MVLLISLVILVLVLLAAVLVMAMRGSKRFSWIEFYLKTREAGLNLTEAGALRDAAVLAGLADPTNILWSPRDLDKAIALLLAKLKDEGRDRSKEGVALMDKSYGLRKQLEFELPRYKVGIRSSGQISQGQRVRMLVHGIGVFNSTVIDNHQRYIVISYPAGTRLPKDWVCIRFLRHRRPPHPERTRPPCLAFRVAPTHAEAEIDPREGSDSGVSLFAQADRGCVRESRARPRAQVPHTGPVRGRGRDRHRRQGAYRPPCKAAIRPRREEHRHERDGPERGLRFREETVNNTRRGGDAQSPDPERDTFLRI